MCRAGVPVRGYAVPRSGGAGRRARYVCGRSGARPDVMTLCSSLRSWIWACVSCGRPAARQAAGLDSALCFTMPPLSTAPALTVGGAPCVPLIATFGQASTATQLPERDLGRLNMQAALTTNRVGFGRCRVHFVVPKQRDPAVLAGLGGFAVRSRCRVMRGMPGGTAPTSPIGCGLGRRGVVLPYHIYKRMEWD